MPTQKSSFATPVAHLVGPGKLKIHNGRLAYSTGQGSPAKLDPRALETVVCYGNVGMSDDAIEVLLQHDVDVSWLSSWGSRLRGRFSRLDQRAANVRALQHRAVADPRICLELARAVVRQKIQSQAVAAKHYYRHGNGPAGALVRGHRGKLYSVKRATSLDTLRGFEGSATRAWFGVLAKLLREPWQFPGRVRRPPTDPVNALLSLGYTWLLNRVTARLQTAGLELYFGALHDYRAGRPSLACDLVEPLRVPLVDRWVVRVCNRHELLPGHFVTTKKEGTRLQRDRFSQTLGLWEEYWQKLNGRGTVDRHVRAFIDQLRELTAADADDP